MKSNLKLRVTNTQNKVFNLCNKQLYKEKGFSWEKGIPSLNIPMLVSHINRSGNALNNSIYKKYRR